MSVVESLAHASTELAWLCHDLSRQARVPRWPRMKVEILDHDVCRRVPRSSAKTSVLEGEFALSEMQVKGATCVYDDIISQPKDKTEEKGEDSDDDVFGPALRRRQKPPPKRPRKEESGAESDDSFLDPRLRPRQPPSRWRAGSRLGAEPPGGMA